MNIEQLYRDYNIPYATEGHRHTRPGWVNTVCPFCTGNAGFHLGFNIQANLFICWRCGNHKSVHTIVKLLRISPAEAFTLLRQYGHHPHKRIKTDHKPKLKAFKYPSNLIDLSERHRSYLIKRKFNPDKIISEWDIMGTFIHSKLDGISYKQRIIIPYYWEGKVVSFTGRDITGKQINKYQSCPLNREFIEHKKILYGKQEYWTETGICVEGATDVWRLGANSFSTSGIKYTIHQVRIMAKNFKRIAVIYDNEPQADKQADKLIADLKFRKVDAFRINIETDPGDMKQNEADYLVKQIIN